MIDQGQPTMTEKLFGGIEGGGTKFNCAIGSGPGHMMAEARIETTSPVETLRNVVDFFKPYLSRLQGVGLGSFGPFDVDPASPTYGFITTTPKPGWADTNILGSLREGLGVPVSVDMDVAAAGLGEARWGAGRGLRLLLYLTVGTGIGGGTILDGKPLHGLFSPEMGHIRIPHDREADPFSGACPYHRDCLEGLASGPAIQARFGRPAEALGVDHPFWDMEALYMAHALVNYILILSPEIIVLGGGVMQNEFLFAKVRKQVQALLNSYIVHQSVLNNIDTYIVPPLLGNRAGVLGGMALAMDATG
jgi:fructokinase